MSVIAFASIGFVPHIYPALAVVRELVERGESVVYIAPEQYRAVIEAAGACCLPFESVPYPSPQRRSLDLFQAGNFPAWVAWGCLTTMPSILQTLKQVQPAVLVYDSITLAARLAGEALALPLVSLSTRILTSNKLCYYTNTGDARLPRNEGITQSIQEYERGMEVVFKGYGLRRRTFFELVLDPADLTIVFVSRTFHPHAGEYGPDVVFVGPGFSRTSRAPLAGNDLARGDKRWLIYVSLGTSYNYQPAFFYSCLEAFAHLDARVILSVGDAFPADYWVGVPDNVSIHSFVPQLDVLADADLFVTCGGMGSVMEALSFGVPMLLVPQQPEQMMNALRADDLGAGIFLDREEVSIRSLRAAATRILTEPSFQQRAQELGDAGRQDGGFRRAADCIQNFVAQRGERPGATPQTNGQNPLAAEQVLQDLGGLSDDQVDELLHRLRHS